MDMLFVVFTYLLTLSVVQSHIVYVFQFTRWQHCLSVATLINTQTHIHRQMDSY